MIDIIIPCYNSNLINTLGSILSQTILNELEVTLVNDGGNSYSEIVKDFSKYIKIKEIGYSINKGVGYARNYGLKNTNNSLITFIDSDDTFNNSYALQVLKDELLSDKNNVICSGKFREETRPFDLIPEINSVHLHGKLYKRSFLLNHNIIFPKARCNEDAVFNMMCRFYLSENEILKLSNNVIYDWRYNENSIVRKDLNKFRDDEAITSYIENIIWLFNEMKNRNYDNKIILNEKINCFIYCCLLHNLVKKRSPKYMDNNFKYFKMYYDSIFKDIENKVTPELFNDLYIKIPVKYRNDLVSINNINEFLKDLQ